MKLNSGYQNLKLKRKVYIVLLIKIDLEAYEKLSPKGRKKDKRVFYFRLRTNL